MKYCIHNNNLVLVNTRDKSLWHFYFSFPDVISLGEIYFGDDFDGDKAMMESEHLKHSFLVKISQYIDKTGFHKGSNIKSMIPLLSEIYQISEDEVKKYVGYDELAVKTCLSLNCSEFHKSFEYDNCKSHLQEWDGDVERVKTYIERVAIPGRHNNALVDIWPTEEDRARPTWPTESFLLHRFHNNWGDELDGYIKEAVEKYPNPKDYDKAYYFVSDKFKEKREQWAKEYKENKKNNK